MIVKASAIPGSDSAYSVVADEPDELRLDLLSGFLADCEGSEDLYLAALDRAEAGTPELNWCNHYVDAEMYPDEEVTRIEKSQFDDRPRSLIQMATGSGKTLLAVTTLYRLIKFGGARRVLFLVDRANLGEQAEKEFQRFRTPDDQRKFTELYTVQRLTSNTLGSSSKVVLSTIQRLYSVLKGEPELDPEAESGPPSTQRSRGFVRHWRSWE
jgi:hypothetical protein